MLTKGLILVGLLSLASTALGLAVMSVDVGSEWMKIAVVSPGVPMEIVLNPESKRKTNMVVSMKDGERKFGSDAMNVCVKSPKHCFSHLLDLVGKTVDNPMVKFYTDRFPHHKIEATERGTVQFRTSEDIVYTIEELLAMIFSHAKNQAEVYAEQKIKDVVVTVPVYFNQAERLALIDAVQLGGLSVLQLMSEPMAVALNYGMFRRKEINGTAKNLILYDMGAQDTTVSIVGYQIVKTKEKGFSETNPQAQILGIGFDRTLGGSEITFRLREHLADKFDAMKKGSKSVREVPRAMGKLLKEAERVKLILSANNDCFAQVENVMEDIDFKTPMSREKLEEIMADTWDRVTVPVQNALEAAGMPMSAIDQVILVGGGSRVPKVQELLTKFINSDLGKNLNTDESAAMGAVYKAADLSSGFKVKKFITKEAVLLPIDVHFERALDPNEEAAVGDGVGTKKVRRTLFSRMNPFPQKKIMTFNKHIQDFRFYVNYNDLDYLGVNEVARLGSNNITSVLVKGVSEALQNNAKDNIETKGVKAHFSLDDSGILSLTSVESVFEKTISVEEQEKLEAEEESKEGDKDDTWAKLGDTISQFFKPDEEEESKDGEKADGADKKKDDKKKKDSKKDTADKKKDKKKEPKKPKIETLKEDLGMESNREDIPALTSELLEAARSKLDVLDQADRDREARETALNELQSLNFDLMDKIYQEEYEVASTEEERQKIQEACSTISEWLDDEAGPFTPLEELNSRTKQLKDLTSALFARVREHKARPEALEAFDKSLANAKDFLAKSRNLTGEDGFFKEKELDVFEKKLKDVETWKATKTKDQEALPLSEMPKLTVSLIHTKIGDLEGEMKYLVSKAKMAKAEKDRERRKKEAEEKKAKEEEEKKRKKEEKEAKKAAEGEAKEGEEKEKVEGEETEDNSNPTVEKPSDSQEQQPEDSSDQSEKQDGADSADSDSSATDTPSGEEAELPVEETSEGSSSDENMKIEL